ncbi:glycosyltransferase family 4 protein [Almyronema epifaneia]|uniref:Glycosyltransferase family 4 protein n=1 Tax=Almyronema epifaneia S1 TaxID=2991925 RepID=A0ABW6ID39_9CYAN
MSSVQSALRLLFLSTPVGPLGSGLGGGVELTLMNLSQELQRRGHQLQVVAPAGSVLGDIPLAQMAGKLQPTAHTQGRQTPTTLPDTAVLANMWDYARQVQDEYDLIVNFAYDWLPFYLMPFFRRPVAQFVSMGSLSVAMDAAICQAAERFPGRIGVYTQAQANTFACATRCRVLGSAVDLSLYEFCAQPQDYLVWMGRISPEKGLEDAIAAAQRSQKRLKILGKLEDPHYWEQIQPACQTAPIDYLGFLTTAQLQTVLRQGQALLMTPRWIEAFGNVAIEALACGVPVIAYQRGGPAEIVQSGKTGWLVPPDSVDGLVKAIAQIAQLDRAACRQQAETAYSLAALGDRFEQWFHDILQSD